MKKTILSLFLIIALFVAGCARNPTAVVYSNIQQQHSESDEYAGLNFDNLTSALNTPEKINKWINYSRSYDKTKTAGWGEIGGDRVSGLAHAFYDETGLVCGNFAGFFAYCLRKAGYEVGGVNYLVKESNVGHTGAFYFEGNKIKCYSLPKASFASYDVMIEYFEYEFSETYGRKIYCVLDETFNEINDLIYLEGYDVGKFGGERDKTGTVPGGGRRDL